MNNNNSSSSNGGGAVPTGCYKCGRPGHWSRDCPSSSSIPPPPNSDNNNNNIPNRAPYNNHQTTTTTTTKDNDKKKKTEKRSVRPKLTPDILLSDRGIGHILRYFPQAFKFRGPAREVNDLQHLLGLYAEWHSRLLPYYNFDQFIHKVEQVGSTRRVKMCLRDLRDKVADGVDPAKMHELPPVVDEENPTDGGQQEGPETNTVIEENNNIWDKVIEEETFDIDTVTGEKDQVNDNDKEKDEGSNKNQMTEEEKNRMEANRLKALERAAMRRAKAKCL